MPVGLSAHLRFRLSVHLQFRFEIRAQSYCFSAKYRRRRPKNFRYLTLIFNLRLLASA